jgi:hypothetical protein
MAGLYFIVAYGILAAYSYQNYFCSPARTGRSHALTTARLAFACTLWDLFASSCGALAAAAIDKFTRWSGKAPLVSTVVAWLGFASIPFWIYQGYGRFLFEDTWADVSCFFTEGYGLAFPIVAAPALAAATLAREWLVVKAQKRQGA